MSIAGNFCHLNEQLRRPLVEVSCWKVLLSFELLKRIRKTTAFFSKT